ncbi:MAG TPA: hypothetical protein VJT15_19770 [Pyrinomonadaceae bacterium]|nr:hypothetical protein [Pyrinomonadaceae bacterium]
MKKQIVLGAILLAVCIAAGSASVYAQETQDTQTPQTQTQTAAADETNFETQLYLLVGTNQDVADPKIPASLDSVMKQLRASLPYKNYRLATTLVNRVKNEGRLDVNSISGPFVPVTSSQNIPQTTPSQFKIRQVKLVRENGQPLVQMSGFYFSSRMAIPVGAAVASNAPAPPAFNYESATLSTDISIREGEPVVVGTLNTGPSGDAIILVVSAKRTQK